MKPVTWIICPFFGVMISNGKIISGEELFNNYTKEASK